MLRKATAHAAASLLFALFAATAAGAQDAALPDAEELIARYVDAIGGRDAFLAYRTMTTKGTFEVPAMGMRGQVEMVQGRPNRMAMRTEIPGLGVSRDGFDGETGWTLDPVGGPRILAGEELAQRRDESHVLSTLRDPDLRAEAETIERTEMGGQACYKVRIVWKSGRESFDCYGVETGLLVGSVTEAVTPMGTIEVTGILSEYREFGAIRMPTRIVQRMMGQEFIVTFTDVSFDDVDESAFELPAEIRALLRDDGDGETDPHGSGAGT